MVRKTLVERYFADVLSGMESDQPCLPNLAKDDEGQWRLVAGTADKLRFPPNLFIVGTVNVDETTYMFSPKVLDRANTIEFRVATEDLLADARKPIPCAPAADDLLLGLSVVAGDTDWQIDHPASHIADFQDRLRTVHRILATEGLEFGHRVFYEASRFAAILEAAGDPALSSALDLQIMQKVLPRLHGTRRKLEGVLTMLGHFSFDHDASWDEIKKREFDPVAQDSALASLPQSFGKVVRMLNSLRANQFVSFTE